MHWTTRANVTAIALVATIGAIDAVVSDQWDLVVVFGVLALLIVPLLTGLDPSRRLVLVRRDLADWLARRSATTGEPLGAIADRSIARHREAVEQQESPTGDG